MKAIKLFWALVCVCFLCSCSVFMAATQPDKKDLDIFKPGVHQSVIRAEFGVPVWQGEEDGSPVDLFKFKQGYSKWAKAGRAVLHGTADLFTIGIWEIVGTPIEVFESGKDSTVKVFYDRDLRAQRIIIQVGNEEKIIAASESKMNLLRLGQMDLIGAYRPFQLGGPTKKCCIGCGRIPGRVSIRFEHSHPKWKIEGQT